MTEVVTLRNGTRVAGSVVRTTALALEALLANHPMAVCELLEACKDPQHAMFGRTGSAALELGLIQGLHFDGRADIHDAVRDIVLASVADDLTLRDPVSTP